MAERLFFAVLLFSSTLTVLTHAKNPPPGFISIDCGLVDETSYEDNNTKLIYQADDDSLINSGKSYSISPEHKTNSLDRQFWYVRSFPEGNRNCYVLDNPSRGNNSVQYLIRARFMYGNYDHKNSTPKFDLYIDVSFWDSVEFDNASTIVTKEIIYPSLWNDQIHVCLCDTNNGTPFISVLERRFVDNYGTGFGYGGILMARFNLGAEDGKIVRYPYDVYDRIWTPYYSHDLSPISTSLNVEVDGDDSIFTPFSVPSIVMKTAAIPANFSDYITFSFSPRHDISIYEPLLYFAEIQNLSNQIREFNIFVGEDSHWSPSEPYQPIYLYAEAYDVENLYQATGRQVWINRTSKSTLPPLLNALEMFAVLNVSTSQTDQNDYEAITSIRQLYRIKRNWNGDPCTPRNFMWEGLNCSNNGPESGHYRITHLNLSSSGLNGTIASWISKLVYLESLDLSNNKLTGKVSDFLSQLEFLRFLNIEANDLSGTIPQELTKRINNGSLILRWGRNPRLCYLDPCKKNHKDNIVIPLASTFGGTFMIIVLAVIIFSMFKRRQQDGKNPNTQGFHSSVSKRMMLLSNNKKVGSKKQKLTYDKILNITNNFERVVGKGGFGTVYHGHLGNTQVAVKMLSPSTQGYLQFQAEARLLTKVHHKCLTPLLGYCHEGTNIALIYEYMQNGDLAKYLSDREKHLSWKQRIQIAVDAAEGLEYLHNGCKPPIVHRDIKSRNILLNEKLRGKIADFGLSKIFPEEGGSYVFTVIAGTPGYLDPEYYVSNRLNEKSDVFSFGVVLLELITGRPAITKTEEKAHIIQWVGSVLPEREIHDIVDSRLQGEFDSDSARKVLDTAMACVASSSINRPSMSQVVVELKQCLAMEMTRESESHDCTVNSFAESNNTFKRLTHVLSSINDSM